MNTKRGQEELLIIHYIIFHVALIKNIGNTWIKNSYNFKWIANKLQTFNKH